jgi:hypothetical protein
VTLDMAKQPTATSIAAALIALVHDCPERFPMRFSNAPQLFEAPSIEHPFKKPAGAILDPEEVGRTESCSIGGLCWATTKRVAFLQH